MSTTNSTTVVETKNENKFNMKKVAFKSVQAITGSLHLVSTATAVISAKAEGSIGEKLGQGKSEDIIVRRNESTASKITKVSELRSDFFAKLEESKNKRLAAKESKNKRLAAKESKNKRLAAKESKSKSK